MGIVADLPVLERFQEHLAGQLIPKRTVPGPLTLDGIPPAEAERLGLPLGRGGPALGDELTWVDGKRSIRDIHRLLALQHDRADLGRLMELFPALAASGLVELSTRGAPEFDREHLLADLRRLGVREGAPLLVHSSMRALGYIMGGAVAALEALLEAVGERGTLVMPTFTHPSELFLPDYTPCYTGTLPEFLRHRSDALRSVHPEYSVVAMGPDAAHLVDGHRRAGAVHSGLGLDSPLHRLARKGGWVLLLGVGHDRNSMIHVGEAVAGAPYLGLADTLLEGRRLRSRFPDGSVVGFEPQQTCSRNFEALHRPLAAAGLVREGPVGSARARLMRAEDVIATVREVLAADPAFLLCDTAACTFCHRARVAALKPRAGLAATPSVSRPAVPEPVASGGRR
jgi:aminoglycoside N3'-acetyltransferase